MPTWWPVVGLIWSGAILLIGLWLRAVEARMDDRFARKRRELDEHQTKITALGEATHQLDLEVSSLDGKINLIRGDAEHDRKNVTALQRTLEGLATKEEMATGFAHLETILRMSGHGGKRPGVGGE